MSKIQNAMCTKNNIAYYKCNTCAIFVKLNRIGIE